MSQIIEFLKNNWLLIASLFLGFLFLLVLVLIFTAKPTPKKPPPLGYARCPLRNRLFPIYDTYGGFTEEYQRIRLIAYFLRKGYSRADLVLEYRLERTFGHKGEQKVNIKVDLVVYKQGKVLVVAEVKKNSEDKYSAIKNQLQPAMDWTGSPYGIYWDGTRHSCYLVRENGVIREREFRV